MNLIIPILMLTLAAALTDCRSENTENSEVSNSKILNTKEIIETFSHVTNLDPTLFDLIYQATRDGFGAEAFHFQM